MGVYIRNDLYLPPTIWDFLPQETAAKDAQKTQTHLFFDGGLTHDHARGVTEKAAGFGVGMSYYHDRFTFSGVIGAPLIQNNILDIGKPIVQIRVEMKTW